MIKVLRLSEKRAKFVKKHRTLFKNGSWDKIVKLARKEIGYSSSTVASDIMRSLTNMYNKTDKGTK